MDIIMPRGEWEQSPTCGTVCILEGPPDPRPLVVHHGAPVAEAGAYVIHVGQPQKTLGKGCTREGGFSYAGLWISCKFS